MVIVIIVISNHHPKMSVLAIATVTGEMKTENDEWYMGREAHIPSTYPIENHTLVLRNDKLSERMVRIILSAILLPSPPRMQPRKPIRH